jgi:DnaJ homolog subfamily C member 17
MPSAIPENDPFETLAVEFGATDAEIAKAYRQLARTLHPDKLPPNATAVEQERAANRFQQIQIARAFLLDAEFAKDRDKYLAKCASQKLRRETDAARDVAQSERRKRLRRELQQQEEASAAATAVHRTQQASVNAKAKTTKELDAQGRTLREELAAKSAANAQEALAVRQVRLKWSRKKLASQFLPSPSEDSLAKTLSQQFGAVTNVLMIGSKGNLALVTFAHTKSCDAIVAQYANSDLWRATYVSDAAKKRQREAELYKLRPTAASGTTTRTTETVDDWKTRRDAAREKVLRGMEEEEEQQQQQGQGDKNNNNGAEPAGGGGGRPFPPSFPAEYASGKSPIEMLAMAEAALLSDVLSFEELHKIRFCEPAS